MNKRLVKRHKRQVARAKDLVRLSEPDLRTLEQLAAAREASRSPAGRRFKPYPYYATPSANRTCPGADRAAKEGISL